MTTRPSQYPNWVDDNDPGNTKILDPGATKKTLGWLPAEKPSYQFMNWLLNLIWNWIKYLDQGVTGTLYDVVIGGANATHATLELAVADAAVLTNSRVLLAVSRTVDTAAIALTKAGWRIVAGPGVTYTAGTSVTCFSMQASGISIERLRFVGFTTAILAAVGWTYGRVMFCNFLTCTNEIDDTLSPAGQKPSPTGNITE